MKYSLCKEFLPHLQKMTLLVKNVRRLNLEFSITFLFFDKRRKMKSGHYQGLKPETPFLKVLIFRKSKAFRKNELKFYSIDLRIWDFPELTKQLFYLCLNDQFYAKFWSFHSKKKVQEKPIHENERYPLN